MADQGLHAIPAAAPDGELTRDLGPLFAPRSIAVVGASDDRSKWGGDLAARLLACAGSRTIYLVNRKSDFIQGVPAHRSLRDLPSPVDLVFLAVPAASFDGAVDDALAAGARAIVVISAGLGELGEEGRDRQRAAVARVRAAGSMLIGPNCAGLADTTTGLAGVALIDIPPGHIAFVGQSGGVGEELVLRCSQAGQGFTRYVTLGNKADLDIAEVLWSLVDHAETRLVALYAEDLSEGRRLVRAMSACVRSGKPVLLLAPGRCAASARAAQSHTGSLTTDAAVVDAVCHASGAERVRSPDELVELAIGLLSGLRVRGRRVAIVSDGGGHGALAADEATEAGLDVPRFGSGLQAQLSELLPENAAVSNPVDFAIASTDPLAHVRVARVLAGSSEVDALLIAGEFGFWGARFPGLEREVSAETEAADALAELAHAADFPVFIASINAGRSPATDAATRAAIPVYRDLPAAMRTLARLANRSDDLAVDMADLPPADSRRIMGHDYWSARDALLAAGVPIVPARRAATRTEALAFGDELGYPLALKAIGQEHKSDVGGVILDIRDAARLAWAFEDLERRLSPPNVSVERMLSPAAGVELIVGCRWDERFGPVGLVGMGGVYAEIFRDVVCALAPLSEATAGLLLDKLRGAPLLRGARGRPVIDRMAACRAIAALSLFAAAHPEISEIEANPLLVTPEGVVALDARLVLSEVPGR